MKPLVILNPHSQGGRTGRQADELLRVLSLQLGEVERADTDGPRHAVDIAEAAAVQGRELVVAVGGDGTIHEVVNGLMRARDGGAAKLPRLGVVGQGTGGDFRKTLGVEHRLDRYCEAIAGGKTRTIDVGRIRYRDRGGNEARGFFVNILSVGMGGLVDEYVAGSSRSMGGAVAYFAASVKALVRCEIGVLACTVHERGATRELEVPTRMFAVCNGRFFGGGMEVAPMAKPDDGLFHVVSLGDAPKLKFVLASMSIYSGKHVRRPDVQVFTCDRIDLDLRNESVRDRFPLDVDGEPLGTLPLTIEVVPGALEVLVPS
jgi:YegS/Rv2252/BmrU family lipid kinase